jgi:hypothetical protein
LPVLKNNRQSHGKDENPVAFLLLYLTFNNEVRRKPTEKEERNVRTGSEIEKR